MEYDSMHQYMLENACIFTKFYFGETRKRYGMGVIFFITHDLRTLSMSFSFNQCSYMLILVLFYLDKTSFLFIFLANLLKFLWDPLSSLFHSSPLSSFSIPITTFAQ